MKITTILITILALLIGGAAAFLATRTQAAPVVLSEGLAAEWAGGAWTLTATLTDTGTQQGEQITLTATVDYIRDGEHVSSRSEPVVLTIGSSELRKQWTTTEPVALEIVAGSAEGSGGCEMLEDGRLRWWVSARNDGQPATFSFKVRPK